MDSNFKLIKDHRYKMMHQLPIMKTQENLNKNGMKTGFHSQFYTNIHASVTAIFIRIFM